MDWARTVAVVVPSPATSEVLLATSRTICAPMFSSESLSSISLATVTPSLVMVGEPNFFSMTTLRPLGPRVTLTASAKRLTPRRIACRDSSPCTICFAISEISYRCDGRLGLQKLEKPVTSFQFSVLKLAARSGELLLGGAGQDAQDFLFAHDDEIFT